MMKFTCQRSGRCCSHPKVFVTLTLGDLGLLLKRTGSIKKFLEGISYLRIEKEMLPQARTELLEQLILKPIQTSEGEVVPALKKKETNAECLYYSAEDHACTIYEHRPLACRAFPLGLGSLQNRRVVTWNALGRDFCPGIGIGDDLSSQRLKNLVDEAEREIRSTNAVVEHINSEARENRPLTARDALLTLLYVGGK